MKIQVIIGALLLTGLSFGQKPDSFDLHVADYRLLLSRKIQAEVGVTLPQRDHLNKLADAERAQVIPYLQQLQKQGKDQTYLKTDKTYLGYLMDFRSKVLATLDAKQLKRLRELSLQSVDLGGLMDILVAKRIGLSDDQLKRARVAYSDGIKKSQAIIEQVNNSIISHYSNTHVKSQAEAKALNDSIQKQRSEGLKKRDPELKAIERQTKAKIQSVLTPQQLASYRALEGKKFTLN